MEQEPRLSLVVTLQWILRATFSDVKAYRFSPGLATAALRDDVGDVSSAVFASEFCAVPDRAVRARNRDNGVTDTTPKAYSRFRRAIFCMSRLHTRRIASNSNSRRANITPLFECVFRPIAGRTPELIEMEALIVLPCQRSGTTWATTIPWMRWSRCDGKLPDHDRNRAANSYVSLIPQRDRLVSTCHFSITRVRCAACGNRSSALVRGRHWAARRWIFSTPGLRGRVPRTGSSARYWRGHSSRPALPMGASECP